MIKKESLRIGNLIYLELGLPGLNIHEIKGQDIADISNGRITLNSIEGIPLSEEWLNKCGFTFEFIKAKESNLPGTIYLAYNGLRLSLGFYRWIPADHYLQLDSPFGSTEIRFVHELMNWFHGLTGQELTIKL